MNRIDFKKLIIPNIPYLLFVWLFDKAAQAFRLSPGADLSGKLLSLGTGFSTALCDPYRSGRGAYLLRERGAALAYTVCQHYGLDTSDYSFGYVAGWSSGKELAELRGSLETIRNTAAEMINAIDGHFAELQKAQEKEKAQPQHEDKPPEQPEAAPQEKAAFSPETIYRVRRKPYSDREENAYLLQAYGLQCLLPPAWWPRRFPPGSSSRQRGLGRTVPGCGHRYGRGPGRAGS